MCEDILNRLRNDNHDTHLQYTDKLYNKGIVMIEDKLQEICEKSLADFGLPPSKRNSRNNIDPLEESLRRPYDLNKLSNYISENEPKLVNHQLLTYNILY